MRLLLILYSFYNKEGAMRKLEINGTGDDHLTQIEGRQLEDGLRVLARIMARAILNERLLLDRSRGKELGDSPMHSHEITTLGKSDEPLALSVMETAKILGVGRSSVYEAIRTGQIPSLRFGKRILVPRAALNKVLAQAGTLEWNRR